MESMNISCLRSHRTVFWRSIECKCWATWSDQVMPAALVQSFLYDANQCVQNITQSGGTCTCVWNFAVRFEGLPNPDNFNANKRHCDKLHYVADYGTYLRKEYVVPLQRVIEHCYPNQVIPFAICEQITEYTTGQIAHHYRHQIARITHAHFCTPLLAGYAQLMLVLVFVTIYTFSFELEFESDMNMDVDSHRDSFPLLLLFCILCASFLVSLLHLLGVTLSFYRCQRYAKVVHAFQTQLKCHVRRRKTRMTAACAATDDIDIESENTLCAFIGFQRWLNVSHLQLENYACLHPHKNIPLLILVASKYWLVSYVQCCFIAAQLLLCVYPETMPAETVALLLIAALVPAGLVLIYCHLRVTLQRTVAQTAFYMANMLSAVAAFVCFELALMYILQHVFDRTAVTSDTSKSSSSSLLSSWPDSSEFEFEQSSFFRFAQAIIDLLVQHMPNISDFGFMCSSLVDVYTGDVYEDYTGVPDEWLRWLFAAGMVSLTDVLLYFLIPSVAGVLIAAWFWLVEYSIFYVDAHTVLCSVTFHDLRDANLDTVGWDIKGIFFDVYYFMPLYRMLWFYALAMYAVYMLSIVCQVWTITVAMYCNFVVFSGVLTVIAAIYVYLQQQQDCLMSGLNTYQFVHKYVAPNTYCYLWGLLKSIVLF